MPRDNAPKIEAKRKSGLSSLLSSLAALPERGWHGFLAVGPGVALCAAVSALAAGVETLEGRWLGGRWLESLVLAILLGAILRTARPLHKSFDAGIGFSAKFLLEVAIVLLGASVSAAALEGAGLALVGGIALTVVLAIGISYGIGRLFSLPPRLALLVACGNSICGNSAIAAAAPVIGAAAEDVAASIAFTAVLGVVVVLLLPFCAPLLHLSVTQYGVMAGLTVYAVPQVLAATAPLGAASVQLGTLVKLVRVLMLGPVIFMLGLGAARAVRTEGSEGTDGAVQKVKLPLKRMVPWFILGFLGMMALRNAGLLPPGALAPMKSASTVLTVLSMAALGLGVDLRAVAHASGRVIAAAALSLCLLGGISLLLIRLLHVG